VTTQPGWHPDPAPQQPGQPPQLRWWDGSRWTEHTTPVPGQQAPGGESRPGPYQGQFGYQPYPVQQDQQQPYARHPYGGPGAKVTPDGVPLSGWWWRVLAFIIDSLILGVVAALIAMPWVRDVIHDYRVWFDAAMDASQNGGTAPDAADLQRQVAGPIAVIGAIQLGLSLVYNVAFLMWRQATPGKLACGLRVRLRGRPGPMPIGTILLRWLGQFGIGVIGLVPTVGGITGVYSILDYLWPLWDSKNQAVHDKIARTNVVRPPRS
jgi:uncharacterized RDD family membrane protein YckC